MNEILFTNELVNEYALSQIIWGRFFQEYRMEFIALIRNGVLIEITSEKFF
ncbi:hypothetical protein LEP1GSC016_1963 [Leptospira borgpetersenii serovar Hardjo-bovis str. Sponselee]|uniref:Uncharacterized protein n=1 Tax=Leptospira borgpetersenii serovar Hardjo-bovis str. Sponselee TaxID=1303729 RepID=M6BX66_LEPBO|nr:hypothetical protein LEP1GSC016_1963 [Leptospira borgpetersenii serovar Hardjo-bovis str. Sponselee]